MLRQPFTNLSLHAPVLMEMAPAHEHIQLPSEGAVEHWVGVEGGTFETCTEHEDPYLIYARSLPRTPAGIQKRRHRKAQVAARPVTRSQVVPRTRVQTARLTY